MACYPVSGQLFVANQPASGARIYFQPIQGGEPEGWTGGYPRATVAADGSFQATTYEAQDGAPAGEYVLLVEWRELAAEGDEPAEEGRPADRLGGRYMDAASSSLRATVKTEPTNLPRIDLR
jgi:hypothetical protein